MGRMIGKIDRSEEYAEKAPRETKVRTKEEKSPEKAQDEEVAEAGIDRHPLMGSGRPCLDIVPRRCDGVSCLLEEAWNAGLRNGLVLYDPAKAAVVAAPPYRYHYLPERAMRPGARKNVSPSPEGLRLAHAPCPFDEESFVREREIFRLQSAGRAYHACCNRYPVTPHHFLVVRAANSSPSTLPQHIHGPGELGDMFSFLQMAGKPFRAYFNSNRGSDGSASGSSINHWHFQLFHFPPGIPSPLLTETATILDEIEGVRIGSVAKWPARHIFVEGADGAIPAAAKALWQRLRVLNEDNVAYNIEVVLLPEMAFRAFLFPRSPAAPLDVPGVDSLSPDFGGWELSGDIVIPTKEILDWIREHPEEAAGLTEKRLRETTRPVH